MFQAISTDQTNKALSRLVAAGEAVVANQILPDSRGIAPAAQPQFDGPAIWLAGTGGCIRTRSLKSLVPGGRFGKIGDHLVGRFCRCPLSAHLVVGRRAPAAYRYALTVSQRTPVACSMPRRGHLSRLSAITCCFFSSLKPLPMPTEPIGPLAGVSVLDFIAGRFSGDLHRPVLGDH